MATATAAAPADGGAPQAPPAGRARRPERGHGAGGGPAARRRRRRAVGRVVTAAIADDDGVDLDELDEETLERRRGRDRKGRPAGRYLMVVHVRATASTRSPCSRAARSIEHYVSPPADDTSQIDGNIYLGRVQNVLPGMEAAFIDIGTPKNAVLYRGDVAYDAERRREAASSPRIEQLLRNGQTIIVQVTKNPIGAKGARLTQEVCLAGPVRRAGARTSRRPTASRSGCPTTSASGCAASSTELRPADARPDRAHRGRGRDRRGARARRRCASTTQWEQIAELAAQGRSRGSLLYREPPLAVRVDPRGVQQGVPRRRHRRPRAVRGGAATTSTAIAPELADRVEFYDAEAESLPLFERFHVHEQLHKALDRKVWLPSGGSLIIERTEALTVIDVNTGKNVGTSNLEETVFRNNLEAAEEIARQLRLRDIGGIIVIDFIDMEIRENRDEVDRGLPRRAGPGQDPHPGVRHLRARPGRDDPQAHRRGPGRGVLRRPARPARAAASSSTSRCSIEPRLALAAEALGSVPGSGRLDAAMYAVINTGGKQYRVAEGQRLDVERLGATSDEVDASRPCCSSTATPCSPRPAQLGGAIGDGHGRRRGQGPEDQRLHLQEQVATSGGAGATASTTPRSRSPAITKG